MGFTLYWQLREYSPAEFAKFVYDVREYTRSNVTPFKQQAMGLTIQEHPMRLDIEYVGLHVGGTTFHLPSQSHYYMSATPHMANYAFTKTNNHEIVTPYLREILNIALRDKIITSWNLDEDEPSRVTRAERAARRGLQGGFQGGLKGGKSRRKRSPKKKSRRSRRSRKV